LEPVGPPLAGIVGQDGDIVHISNESARVLIAVSSESQADDYRSVRPGGRPIHQKLQDISVW
jgi:hypothetical protein